MKGILFKPAIWEAKKRVLEQYGLAVTRRAMNPQPLDSYLSDSDMIKRLKAIPKHTIKIQDKDDPNFIHIIPAPRYQVGEVVYIKEAWKYMGTQHISEGKPVFLKDARTSTTIRYGDGIYRTIEIDTPWRKSYAREGNQSPLFMPAWAARDHIKFTDVRAERLQEITEEDAIAEGCLQQEVPYDTAPYWQYKDLWDSINAKPKPVLYKGEKRISHYESYPWEEGDRVETFRGKPHYIHGNPFVFRYGFVPSPKESG